MKEKNEIDQEIILVEQVKEDFGPRHERKFGIVKEGDK